MSEQDGSKAAPEAEREGIPVEAKIGVVLLLLFGVPIALMLLTGAGDSISYSEPVAEVVADPDNYQGRQLRVEGMLRQGSIQFREEPCEWRFTIEEQQASASDGLQSAMQVTFPQCVVPDTFRDGFGISVTVQGEIRADGTFLANEVVPRCPSKYEMQQRLEAGEEMPHPAS